MAILNHGLSSPSAFVPGPKPLPLLGGTTHLLRLFKDPVGHTGKLFHTYGPVAALIQGMGVNFYSSQVGTPANVFVYGPKYLQQAAVLHDIYSKHALTGKLYRKRRDFSRTAPLNYLLGGLFQLNGNEHRQHRRLLLPAFHKQQIASYHDVIVALTEDMCKTLPLTTPVRIVDMMRALTMKIVATTIFATDIQHIEKDLSDIIWTCDEYMASLSVHLLPFDVPGLPFHHMLDSIGQLDGILRHIINKKINNPIKDALDALSMLIQANDEHGNGLTEDEILGHVSSLLGAGADSSSSALSWTLLLLAQHPAILADLVDELDAVLHGDAPTIEQLHQLPLLDAVLKESMRILPPVPFTGCILTEDTEVGGYQIAAGSEIFPSVYHTHHMPEIYAEPEVFQPRRWETLRPSIFEYQPFSAGARMCIAASYAMMEMKIILSILLQRYRFECVPHAQVNRSGLAVLNPKEGLPMFVHHQDRQFSHNVGEIHGNIHEMVTF